MVDLKKSVIPIGSLHGEGIYEQFLKALAAPGDPTQLTFEEVQKAKTTTPEIFFRQAHCYAATRWFLDKKDGRNPPEELRSFAVRAIFSGACDFEKEDDLGSIVKWMTLALRTRGIQRRPEQVMPMRILLHGGREVLERAVENLPPLSESDFLAILEEVDPSALASNDTLLFPLTQELERRGMRHEKTGGILLSALQKSAVKWLTRALRVSKKEKDKIEGNLGILPFLRSLRQEFEREDRPRESPLSVPPKPPELTVSMKYAYFIGHVAKPTRPLLKELAAIAVNSERYPDGTRAHVVAAMRRLVVASGDPEMAAFVADRLFQILDGKHLSRYQEVWGWTLRESLETLKEIPFRITEKQAGILKFYLFNTEQPIGSLLAVAVLGKRRLPTSGKLRESIDHALLDAINMPRNRLVQEAAAVWLNRE